ncbi:MAG: hypothetical protein HKM04_06540 [Legionellales bacterium]|nr:hypothetical protein [Legionellales bacterium]
MKKAIFRTLFSLLGILLGALVFFSCTHIGLIALVSLVDAMIPGHIQAEVISGSLLGNLHIKKLVYRNSQLPINVKLDELQVEWHISQWFPFMISIPAVDVKGAQMTWQESTYQISHIVIAGQLDSENKTHLILQWENAHVPLNSDLVLSLPKGELQVTGSLSRYHAKGNFLTEGADYLQGKWELNQTTGTLHSLNIESLTAASKVGNIVINGQLDWLNELKWDIYLDAKKLNTAVLTSSFTSDLNIFLHSQGIMSETVPRYFLDLQNLTGTFDGLPLLGHGKVTIQANDYEVDHLTLKAGLANLQVNGGIAPTQANLHWQLQIPSLTKLIPDAEGSISSQGTLGGDFNNPHIVGNLSLSSMKWKTANLAKLNAVFDTYTNFNDTSQLQVSLSHLMIGATQIDNGQLAFKNQKNQNQLHIVLAEPNLNGVFDANGRLVNKQWQGKINTLNVGMKQLGEISLKQPVNLTLTQQSFNFKPFCLQGTLGNLCIQQAEFAVGAQGRDASTAPPIKGALQLSSEDLSFIDGFFPQLAHIGGKLAINFHFTGTTVKPLVSGRASLANGGLEIPVLGVKMEDANLNATGNNDNIVYTAKAKLGSNVLNITGKTDLANTSFPTYVTVKGSDLLVMNTDDAVVKVSPDLQVTWLNSLLSITGNLNIPFASITPRDMTSTVTLPSDVVFVTPGKQTTQQLLQIYSNIKISLGDNIRFSYSGLSGKVTGSVRVEDKPGGDTMGSGALSIEQGKYKAYGQDLSIRQGRLIYTGGAINNPGLNIEAVKTVQLVSSVTGAKSTGSSYSSSQQIVGMRITGTLNAPSMHLFAEPAGLSQSDILSYLVLGRPASQATQADNPSVVQALSLLSMGGGVTSQLKNQFTSAFGLSQLSLSQEEEYDQQQNSVVENTSLLLGKVLSPRLSVTYSLGLIEPINTLKVVYKLRNNISLQSEHSTEGDGVDLFYLFERN